MATTDVSVEGILPGQTVRIDFEILKEDPVQIGMAISSIKKAIYSDDRFDYQGSKIQTVGDVELKRDVRLLSIYATLRKERRETHQPIEYANIRTFDAMVFVAVDPFVKFVKHAKTTIVSGVDFLIGLAKDGTVRNFGWATLLVAIVLAYWFFLGRPRQA